jgi:predicted DsbA family dithiol-disulfide isomerase
MTAASTEAPLTIDVVSDVVCPWCYIGKRRLEAALAQLDRDGPLWVRRVNWQPFQLNPDLPREGVDRRTYLEQKFGGPQRAATIYERVRAAGATVDIPFAFERIRRQPNTRDAHRLIDWAQGPEVAGSAGALVERLFSAYFLEGRAIGEREVLAAIAGEAGFDAESALAMLESESGAGTIDAMQDRARALGVTGVPFFIFNGRVAVSGAQEPQVLAEAIAEATKLDGA